MTSEQSVIEIKSRLSRLVCHRECYRYHGTRHKLQLSWAQWSDWISIYMVHHKSHCPRIETQKDYTMLIYVFSHSFEHVSITSSCDDEISRRRIIDSRQHRSNRLLDIEAYLIECGCLGWAAIVMVECSVECFHGMGEMS